MQISRVEAGRGTFSAQVDRRLTAPVPDPTERKLRELRLLTEEAAALEALWAELPPAADA